jgi:hypothetical protein
VVANEKNDTAYGCYTPDETRKFADQVGKCEVAGKEQSAKDY